MMAHDASTYTTSPASLIGQSKALALSVCKVLLNPQEMLQNPSASPANYPERITPFRNASAYYLAA